MTPQKLLVLLVGLGLALAACSSSSPPPAAEAPRPATVAKDEIRTVEVTATRLNVRQSASPKGAVVGSLQQGERVAAPFDPVDGWIFVQSGDVSGYVSAQYVRETTSTHTPPVAAPASSPAPPSGSPLSRVKEGMTSSQVVEILGAPTSEQNYVTGKAWIPYYYGSDTSRVAFKYAGVGRVVFSRNRYSGTLKVIQIEADASEDGS